MRRRVWQTSCMNSSRLFQFIHCLIEILILSFSKLPLAQFNPRFQLFLGIGLLWFLLHITILRQLLSQPNQIGGRECVVKIVTQTIQCCRTHIISFLFVGFTRQRYKLFLKLPKFSGIKKTPTRTSLITPRQHGIPRCRSHRMIISTPLIFEVYRR